MIDLTTYKYDLNELENKVIIEGWFNLSKSEMIKCLGQDVISMNGDYYKVPEFQILQYLINKNYGDVKLTLERIKK